MNTLLRLLSILIVSYTVKANAYKKRHLALGDFAELNSILNGAVLRINDANLNGSGVSLRLTNIRCWNIAIGDINLWPRRSSMQRVSMDMEVTDVDMFCRMNYSFSWLFLSGSGTVDVASYGNDATLTGHVSSPNLFTVPPEDIVIERCNPTVNINSITFSGGIIGIVLNTIRGLIRGFMANAAETQICTQLRESMESTESFLELAKETLDKYKVTDVIYNWDPLLLENNLWYLGLSDDVKFLNFRDENSDFGQTVENGVNLIVDFLSAQEQDPTTKLWDMQANILMREHLLDTNGYLEIDSTFLDDTTVYEGHNQIVQTFVRFDKLKLSGLDSLTQFNPLDNIGNYTFQNQLAWDHLGFHIQATFDIRPSTLSDSIIESPGDTRIVEQVEIFIGIDDLSADVSILSLFDQDLLQSMTFGSLLQKDNIIPCLLSTIIYADLTSLVADAQDILSPTVDGFVSTGFDRIISQSLDAGSLMYEKLLLNAAPAYFQMEMRPLFADMFLKSKIQGASCPSSEWITSNNTDRILDFRDLLLSPSDAIAAGASGTEPYGNLFSSFIMPYLQNNVFQGDLFNDGFIRPLTKAQSGKEGALAFSTIFYEYSSADSNLYDSFIFQLSNLRIENLDSVSGPLKLLEPRNWDTLANAITFDSKTGNLTATISIELTTTGEDVPLRMKNIFDLSLSIPYSNLSFDVMARFNEASLINFPLWDWQKYHCWLAALDHSFARSLALLTLSLDIESFYLDADCVSCSSPGLTYLSGMLQQLDRNGFNTIFKDKVVEVVVGILADYTQAIEIDKLILDAPKHCPHHPHYDADTAPIDFDWNILPRLRPDALETTIAIGSIALQLCIVLSAKNQLLLVEEDGDEYDDSSDISYPINSSIINWTSISEDIGDWAGLAFDDLRNYLQRTSKDFPKGSNGRYLESGIDLEVNNILREYVLDIDGSYVIEMEDLSIEAMGFSIVLSHARIYGLDSITHITPLVPVAPQRLANNFHFESLALQLEVEIISSDGGKQSMTISYAFKDVYAEIDVDIAIDLSLLGKTYLGSLFEMEKVLVCAAKSIHDMKFSELKLQFGEIENPVINGYFSNDTLESTQLLIDILFDTNRDDLSFAIPILLNNSIRKIVNAMLPDVLESLGHQCTVPTASSLAAIIDFRDLLLSERMSLLYGGTGTSPYGDLFRTIYELLNEKVLQTGASNKPLINDVLRDFTKEMSNVTGSLWYPGDSFENDSHIKIAGLDASFRFVLSDVLLENIDSVGDPLAIFLPVSGEPYKLDNTFSFGVDSKPFGVSGNMLLSLEDGEDIKIRNQMNFSFSVEDIIMLATFLLKVPETNLYYFPLEDFANIHCWLAAILSTTDANIGGVEFIEQSFSIGNFSMTAECISCTSPKFDDFLLSIYDFSNATGALSSLQEKLDNIMDTEFWTNLLNYMAEDSVKRCPHRPEFDPTDQQFRLSDDDDSPGFFQVIEPLEKPIYFNIANATLAFCIFLFGAFVRRIVYRRNKRWIDSLTEIGNFHFQLQKEKEKQMEQILNEMTSSMFKSNCIPKKVRYGVPVALLLNLGLYVGGHTLTLSQVDIDASLAGEEFTIHRFLEFTFLGSTKKTYENGGAEMIILLWLFTGVWPYIKILLSLLMWFLSPHRLSVMSRGRVFLWIDALAKLSVIDIFTLIVGVALLLVFIGGPDESYLGDEVMYSLKAVVVPRAGFYCIIVAQRISRVSSRFFLEYHEQVIQAAATMHDRARQSQNAMHSLPGTLSSSNELYKDEKCQAHSGQHLPFSPTLAKPLDDNEASSIPSSGKLEPQKRKLPQTDIRWGTIGVYFCGLSILIIAIIGAIFAPSISLDASSIAALAIDSDKSYEEIAGAYGVFLVISGVLLKARFVFDETMDYIGFGFLLFAFAVSVGMVLIIQIYQFIKRMMEKRKSPKEEQKHSHDGCGIPFYIRLRKWRHMEIYFISLAIGTWQLGSISSYAIYFYCQILYQSFELLAFVGLVEETSAQCYQVQASLPENLSIILGSVCILVVTFVMQAKAQYVKNVKDGLRWIDDGDVPHLSLAWSSDQSRNLKYSHLSMGLTASMSWDTNDTDCSEGNCNSESRRTEDDSQD